MRGLVLLRFGRSESTPELHRIRKMDHLLLSTEKTGAFEKTQNNILHESQGSHLSNFMSDSLPDIFRKPIMQPQTDSQLSLLSKPACVEEKLSKWGYGPSSFSSGISATKATSSTFKDASSKHCAENMSFTKAVREDATPLKKLPVLVPTSTNKKIEFPSWNTYERHVDTSNSVSNQPEGSTATKCPNKSDLSLTSDTTSALGLSTQVTVKSYPVEKPASSPVKASGTSNHITSLSTLYTQKSPESILAAPSNSLRTSPNRGSTIPSSHTSMQILVNSGVLEAPSLMDLGITPALKPNLPSYDAQPSLQDNPESHSKLSAAPSNLPPPSSRPPHKTKQIVVNGKLYTVMKPLGRGGSSVVFQVNHFMKQTI